MTYLLIGFGHSNQNIAKHLITSGIPFDVFTDEAFQSQFALPESTMIIHQVTDLKGERYSGIVKSPGISHNHPVFAHLSSFDLPVQNEISFSLPYVKQPLMAITGTNGKTTVTSLVAHILSDRKARAVGNIGSSFSEAAMLSNDPLVVELSSFQLKDLTSFSPDVSAFLNFQPSHLDYHQTQEDYFESKMNIVRSQDTNKPFVFNLDDAEVAKTARKRGGNLRSFSLVDDGACAFFDGKTFFVYGDPWLTKDDIHLIGDHNYQNVLAALLIAYSYESKSAIVEKVKSFTGVEHRLEALPNTQGFSIYNDSKSTNPASTVSALHSFDRPVVLLLGGKDRGNDFSVILDEASTIQHICLFGEMASILEKQFAGNVSFSVHSTVEEASAEAFKRMNPTNVVLFSPGCSSWDQFNNFEERGHLFKSLVSRFLQTNSVPVLS